MARHVELRRSPKALTTATRDMRVGSSLGAAFPFCSLLEVQSIIDSTRRGLAMAEAQREAKITPEVEPLSELLAHPLLQDPKFVAAAVGLLLLVVVVTGTSQTHSSREEQFELTCSLPPKVQDCWAIRASDCPPCRAVGRWQDLPVRQGELRYLDCCVALLIMKLVHGTYPQTHTSVVLSSTVISLDNSSRQVRLVDMPGHPRLRDEVKKRIPEADAVVFVVDIVGLVRNAATIAEWVLPFDESEVAC